MAHRLLFVCAMNVCRSPLAAGSFLNALSAEERKGWIVHSAGTAAEDGHAMCGVAAQLLGEEGKSFAAAHASREVSEDRLSTYDAIVVATRSERAVIARLDPTVRSRTFVLKEALLLGQRPVREEEHLTAIHTSGETEGRRRVRNYATVLNYRRGLIPLPAARETTRIRRRTRSIDPLDSPDVHMLAGRKHEAGLVSVVADVRTLHRQMNTYLNG